MKIKFSLLCIVLCLVSAASARTINKIVFKRNLCGPVMLLDAVGGWYKVYDGESFEGGYNFIRGYDCNCNGLTIRHDSEYARPGDNKSDFIRTWYVGVSVLPYYNDTYHDCPNDHKEKEPESNNSSSSSSSSSYSSSNSSSYSSSSSSYSGQSFDREAYMSGRQSRVGLLVAGGISSAWGENLDFRFWAGSTKVAFVLSGAVGTDWIKDCDKTLWNVAAGMYFGDMPKNYYSYNIGWDFKFGRTCMTQPTSYGFLLDVNTTHLFTRSQVIGITATLGVGGANLQSNKPAFLWDASVGLVIFFLQSAWFD